MKERYTGSDRRLVEACLKKDLSAWAELVQKYSRLVCISIENRLKKYNILASRQDVEDIKQDLLADIWKNNKLAGVVNRDDISYWISILSGNAAIEYFRSTSKRLQEKTISLSLKVEESEFGEFLQSKSSGPDDELANAETSFKIDKAIKSLQGREKAMVKLHLVHGKKYHEIADIMNVPAGTVSSYIKRAKEKLKKALRHI